MGNIEQYTKKCPQLKPMQLFCNFLLFSALTNGPLHAYSVSDLKCIWKCLKV